MKILGPGEENGLNINTGINVVSFSHNSVSKTLLESKQAEHFIGLLRHGLTIANVEKDARKEADEPLLETELGPDSTIRKQARNFLNFGINKEELCIHFDPIVKRDRQTAKVFCDELGLAFPNKEEMVDEKVMERKYPYLKLTRALATREKGSIANNEIPIQGTEKNKAGAESILESRVRIFDYVENLKKNISNNSYKHHIMVGHRTGTNGFIDAKYNRSKIDLINDMKESDVSQLDYGFLNQAGEFINLKKQLYSKQGEIKTHDLNGLFEFDISQYPQQVEELKNTISTLKILSGNNIIEDTNIINAYMENIKQDIVANKTEQKIIHYLNIKNNYIQSYILSFLIDIIIDSKDKKIENILIQYIGDKNISEQEKCRWIAKLYTNNHELRKYILYVIYTNNKSITSNHILSELIEEERKKLPLGSDGRLIPKTKIEEEIEKISNRLKYLDMEIETVIGKHRFSDIYVEQEITKNGKDDNSNNSKEMLISILESKKSLHFVSAYAGNGKSFLANRLEILMNDTDFLYNNGYLGHQVLSIDINTIESNETVDSFIDRFGLDAKTPTLLIFDALDEKNKDKIKILQKILQDKNFAQKYQHIKFVLTSRYFDKSWGADETTEESTAYRINTTNDLQGYIDSYKKFLPNKRQEAHYNNLVNTIQKKLGGFFSPLLVGMLVLLVDNSLIRKKIAEGEIKRSDIYEAFIDEYMIREEKKDNMQSDDEEQFYDVQYNTSKKKLLERYIKETLNQRNPIYHQYFKLSKKTQHHDDHRYYKEHINDIEYMQFLNKFVNDLGEKQKHLFTYKYIYPPGVKSSISGGDVLDIKKFDSFLNHLSKIGFLKDEGNSYTFALNNLHESFYNFIGHENIKDKPLQEYFANFLDLLNRSEEDINLLHDSTFIKDMGFDDIFYVKQNKDFYEFLPTELQKEITNFSYSEDRKEEKLLLEKVNKLYPEYVKKSSRLLKNIHEYLVFRFFDSKKDLLPLLELLEKQKDSLNNILGEEYYTVIPNFLKEIVGTNSINYDFFTECDKVDEKKAEHNLLRTDGITFIKGDQNQHKILIDKAIEAANTEGDTLLEYQLKIFLNGKSNPMSREYRHLLSIFSPGQNNQTSGISLSKEEKNHLFHLIQLREIKNRGGNKERYIDYQESQQKKSSIYTLESEYLGDFNYLYQLSKYVNKNDEIHYINDLNDIRSKITRASQGKKITGDLYNNIMETTKKYGLDITKSRNYDELPAGFFHVLMGSTTEFLTNKYFGFT